MIVIDAVDAFETFDALNQLNQLFEGSVRGVPTLPSRNDCEVVEYDGSSPKWRIFWTLFHVVGFPVLLAVKLKTYILVWFLASKEERENFSATISRARKNFGKNKFSRIFQFRTLLLSGLSPLMGHFLKHVAGSWALNAVYHRLGEFKLPNTGGRIWPSIFRVPPSDSVWGKFWRWVNRLWSKIDPQSWFFLQTPQSQGVKSRFRWVSQRIVRRCLELRESGVDDIKLLEVACGDGWPTVWAISYLRYNKGVDVRAVLVDGSPEALSLVTYHADLAGVADLVTTRKVFFLKASRDKILGEMVGSFHLVLSIGLDDYLDNRRSLKLYDISRFFLIEGGIFMVSNMTRTEFAPLLEVLFNWWIGYLSTAEIRNRSHGAGAKRVVINFVDPFRIFTVSEVLFYPTSLFKIEKLAA